MPVVATLLYLQSERTQDAPKGWMITVLYQHLERKQFIYDFELFYLFK
jgi:hypothetical protein